MDIKLIKELREKTGAGMANCKEALIATDGNIEKAIEYLRKKGAATAAKRAEKVTKEGAVKIAVSDDKKSAAIIELNCETDFVSKGEKFQNLSQKIAEICLKNKVNNVEDLLKTKDENNLTVKDNIDDLVASVGEKVELRRVKYVEINDGFVSSYLHFGSKLGGLVVVRGEYNDFSYDLGNKISMQVVAMNPMAINRDGIPADILEKEKEIYITVAKGENKPENIIQKIVENKLEKFYQENCLLEQEYINEANLSIGDLIKRFEQEKGTKFEIVEIVRFQLGM